MSDARPDPDLNEIVPELKGIILDTRSDLDKVVSVCRDLATAVEGKASRSLVMLALIVLAVINLTATFLGGGLALNWIDESVDNGHEQRRLIIECVAPIADDPEPELSTTVEQGRCYERAVAVRTAERRMVLCETWRIGYEVTKAQGLPAPRPIDPEKVGGISCPVPVA